MASKMGCVNQESGGCFFNTCLFTDGTATSPSAATVTLVVPKGAGTFVVKNRTGSSNAVAVSFPGQTGSYTLTAGEREEFDVMGFGATLYPTTITLTIGATTNADWFFRSKTATGA